VDHGDIVYIHDFMYLCSNFDRQRSNLINSYAEIKPDLGLDIHTLLWGNKKLSRGDNIHIFRLAQNFIEQTHRFE